MPDTSWGSVHRFIVSNWLNGVYNFSTLVEGLAAYQEEFAISINENKEFLISYCEVLQKEHRDAFRSGQTKISYPSRLVSSLKELGQFNYVNSYATLPIDEEEKIIEPVAKKAISSYPKYWATGIAKRFKK